MKKKTLAILRIAGAVAEDVGSKMRTRLGLILLAVAATCGAQTTTTVATDQLRAPAAPKPMVTIALPSGVITMATLGAGISIDMNTTPPTLVVTATAPAPSLAQRQLAVAADKTIAVTGLILLMRNGVTMHEGANADFIRTATGVTITKQPVVSTDQWSCLCAN
jgi:hypothetical protein